jgi:ParB family chromosome partitioning protein
LGIGVEGWTREVERLDTNEAAALGSSLTELAAEVVEAFAKDEVGVGHALLLAKLQPEQQLEALTACYQEQYSNASKAKRILLPVRHLQQWIEHNIFLELASAPFSKDDAELVPEAGACLNCSKRTGHNKLLFGGMEPQNDSCSDPQCYAEKVEAHVRQTIALKPKLVQISTAYGVQKEGSAAIPRNRYVEIRQEKPTKREQANWPEYKTCKFTSEAIVIEGSEKGEIRRVCANPECPIHHARKPKPAADAAIKAEQEKRKREEPIAQVTGLRVLHAITEAVPVRLMKRDLIFVVERLIAVLDERRLPNEPLALSLDAGVDTHEFRPWHFDEIQAVMQPKAVARESRFQAERRAALAEQAARDQEIGI